MGTLIVFVSPALIVILSVCMVLSWTSRTEIQEKFMDLSVMGASLVAVLLTIAFA